MGVHSPKQKQLNNVATATRAVESDGPAFASIHHMYQAPAQEVRRQRVARPVYDLQVSAPPGPQPFEDALQPSDHGQSTKSGKPSKG